jgi:hypothetical protein
VKVETRKKKEKKSYKMEDFATPVVIRVAKESN